jgi:methylisocitrate lyase
MVDGSAAGTSTVTSAAALRTSLAGGETLFVPYCPDALTARLCEELGYPAGYLSGGALGYTMAVSEALLTYTELAGATAAITKRSSLPMVIDGGVGFGDPVHMTRTIWELEAAGAAAIEIEDQVSPKRASHHRGVEHLVPIEVMVDRIRFAARARRDPSVVIIARTSEHASYAAAMERAHAYVDAGADAILLMARLPADGPAVPPDLGRPVVTVAPWGARPRQEWIDLGYAMVIDVLTGQCVAFDALRRTYQQFQDLGRLEISPVEVRSVYDQLPRLAGLEELYDIERATTEPGT